jgi:predicted enzyme related to lactoylglutathione lyase
MIPLKSLREPLVLIHPSHSLASIRQRSDERNPADVTKDELFMNQGIRLFVYPVKEIARAKALYSKLLGVQPYADSAYYVGFRVGDQEIGFDPSGYKKGMTGPVGYWSVSDIKKSLQALLDAGAQVQQEVTDVGGGKLIAWVRDADGNITGLIQSP